MQVQACKDRVSTSVKVVTPKTIREEHDRFQCLNHRDELNRSTLNFDIVEKTTDLDASVSDELDGAIQTGLDTCTIACTNAIIYYSTSYLGIM